MQPQSLRYALQDLKSTVKNHAPISTPLCAIECKIQHRIKIPRRLDIDLRIYPRP
jgi:hypothetical protein